jgi:regulator of protease activity HflC (stomatin/prohibitin superfamily)
MTYEILIPACAAAIVAALVIRSRWCREFIVAEGSTALLYRRGRFERTLGPGRHVCWGRNVTVNLVDLRRSLMAIGGQEVLTADSVSVKAGLVAGYRVTDPVKAVHESQNWVGDLYHAAQIALREAVGAVPVEGLLVQRAGIAGQILTRLQADGTRIGVTVEGAEVRDFMFPAELKRAFAEVLRAKQEGQAAIERARGETAALRNLANAARLMEGNPALLNLRLIQSVATAQSGGNTLVFGLPGGFVPLAPGGTPAKNAGGGERAPG